MATPTLKNPLAALETLADLLDRRGNVPPERIRCKPFPGTARERDAITALESANKLPDEAVASVVPDLAAEVLSISCAGTRLFWAIDWRTAT